MRIFLIPLSITFQPPEILRFLFSEKNSVTWVVKYEKQEPHNGVTLGLPVCVTVCHAAPKLHPSLPRRRS